MKLHTCTALGSILAIGRADKYEHGKPPPTSPPPRLRRRQTEPVVTKVILFLNPSALTSLLSREASSRWRRLKLTQRIHQRFIPRICSRILCSCVFSPRLTKMQMAQANKMNTPKSYSSNMFKDFVSMCVFSEANEGRSETPSCIKNLIGTEMKR